MKPPKTIAEKKAAAFLEQRLPHVVQRSGRNDDAIDLLVAELNRRLPRVTGARVPSMRPGTRTAQMLTESTVG